MRTGKLTISRGYQLDQAAPPVPRLSLVPRAAEPPSPEPELGPPPGLPEYQAVKERLAGIERLARLYKQGALTDDEFAAEKAALLSRRSDPRFVTASIPCAPVPEVHSMRGPTLLGRIFGWKVLPVGIVAGLAFSYASQPRETLDFFDEALRLVGV
jgi:hypothetical protein